ncbi:MAG: hypothetical protein KDA45_16965, partial [Planctomycetales bacterium]|nr:hypothetical protein [Planctomycetales bacterium]
VALSEIRELPRPVGEVEPQATAGEHPILAPLQQLSVSPFLLLRVRKQFVPSQESLAQGGLEVAARGPGQIPLLIDKGMGEGRVVSLLTGLTSDWSNWAQDPTFVVLTLRSFGYLGSFRRAATSEAVGSPLEMVVSGNSVLPEAEVLLPAGGSGPRSRLLREVIINTEEPLMSRIEVAIDLGQMDRDLIDGLLRPGVFEAWMVNSQGEKLYQNFAHNVAAAEGNLERVTPRELEKKLADVPLSIRTAEAVRGSGLNSPEAAHSTLLMALLAALLLVEQLLAYSASYHAPRFVGAVR